MNKLLYLNFLNKKNKFNNFTSMQILYSVKILLYHTIEMKYFEIKILLVTEYKKV